MRKYVIFSVMLLLTVSLFGQELVEKWAIMADDPAYEWFKSDYSTKGAAFNPVTGNVLVAAVDVERDEEEEIIGVDFDIIVLSGEDGTELGALTPPAEGYRIFLRTDEEEDNGDIVEVDIYDSFRGVAKVFVLPSGRIIATNHTTSPDDNVNKLFVWEEEEIGGVPPLVIEHPAAVRSGNTLSAVEKDNGDILVYVSTNHWGLDVYSLIKYEYTSATDTWEAVDETPVEIPRSFSMTVYEDGTFSRNLLWNEVTFHNPDGSEIPGIGFNLSGHLYSCIYETPEGPVFVATSMYAQDADGIRFYQAADMESAKANDFTELLMLPRTEYFANPAIQGDGQLTMKLSEFEYPGQPQLYFSVMIQNQFIALFHWDTATPTSATIWQLFE